MVTSFFIFLLRGLITLNVSKMYVSKRLPCLYVNASLGKVRMTNYPMYHFSL